MAQEPGAPKAHTDKARTDAQRDTRQIVRLVAYAVGLLLLIAFIVGNSSSVRVNFVFFSHSASLIWVIVIAAVLGVLVDRLVIALGKRRRSRK